MQNTLAPANAAALLSVPGHGRRLRRREGLNILFSLQAYDRAPTNQHRHGITDSRSNSHSICEPNNPINQAGFETCRRNMVLTFATGNIGPAWNTRNNLKVFKFKVIEPGTSTWRMTDISSARANYTLDGSQVKQVPAN